MLIKGDAIARFFFKGALCVGVICLLLMFFFIFRESSIGVSFNPDLAGFLFDNEWSPLASPPSLGIFHALLSTLYVSGISLLIAIPLGIGIGLFLSEIAPPKVQLTLQPALELLAGIPAVVYGFFGYVVLVKNFENWFDMSTGECVLVAGLILALMVLPFIASTSAESFRRVSREVREAAFSLGVNRSYVIYKILLKKAMPGLFAAITLGLARALGETLAVLMLAGNSVDVPQSLFDRAQPITALLATELGETAVGSEKYHALYTSGLFLLLVVLVINISIWFVKNRVLRSSHA
jgi:phosphate transport system permease protein